MEIPTLPPVHHIYCDESCTQHRYTAIGSIFCSESVAPRAAGLVQAVAEKHGGTSELKWSKIKKHNLPMYKDIVSLFRELKARDWLHYYCLVVDTSKMDYKTFHEGDKEIGFNKMLYQHLLTFARRYRRARFNVYLDDRTTVHPPERLRRMLNDRARRTFPRGFSPYRVCQFQQSHRSPLIQLADILTGAIGSATNGLHLRHNSAAHKADVIRHIEVATDRPALSIPTGQRIDGFEIWHIDFSKSRRRGPASLGRG